MPYFVISKNNKLTFYLDNGQSTIPEGAIPILDELWGECMNEPDKYVWGGNTLKPNPAWVSRLSTPPPPDWKGLLTRLRATPIYAKAMGTSNPNAWAVLLFALGTSHNTNDLEHALVMVRNGLYEDFNALELGQINQFLTDCNIGVQIQ